MSFSTRPLKNKKPQLRCHGCQEVCPPKNGDWHQAPAGSGQGQVFLCRACETKSKLR